MNLKLLKCIIQNNKNKNYLQIMNIYTYQKKTRKKSKCKNIKKWKYKTLKHKTEDYKISAVKYYINNEVSMDEVCEIFECKKTSILTFVNTLVCLLFSFIALSGYCYFVKN